jgi:hypothetical protein
MVSDCVPIFVGDLGHLMLFLLLSRSDFSGEVPGCSDVRAVLQANGGTTDIDYEVTSSEHYGL